MLSLLDTKAGIAFHALPASSRESINREHDSHLCNQVHICLQRQQQYEQYKPLLPSRRISTLLGSGYGFIKFHDYNHQITDINYPCISTSTSSFFIGHHQPIILNHCHQTTSTPTVFNRLHQHIDTNHSHRTTPTSTHLHQRVLRSLTYLRCLPGPLHVVTRFSRATSASLVRLINRLNALG